MVLGFGCASLRRLAGGGPSVLTQISAASGCFIGDALPEGAALELGDGYLLDASSTGGEDGGEGELERTERGEDGGDDGSGFTAQSMAVVRSARERDCSGFERRNNKVS